MTQIFKKKMHLDLFVNLRGEKYVLDIIFLASQFTL